MYHDFQQSKLTGLHLHRAAFEDNVLKGLFRVAFVLQSMLYVHLDRYQNLVQMDDKLIFANFARYLEGELSFDLLDSMLVLLKFYNILRMEA